MCDAKAYVGNQRGPGNIALTPHDKSGIDSEGLKINSHSQSIIYRKVIDRNSWGSDLSWLERKGFLEFLPQVINN